MKKLALLVLVALTLVLRWHNVESKLSFDWDQNRDMQQVTQMLHDRKPVLLGPIVKGEAGGFYLGPLYYYALTPIVAFTGGNPVALSIVSIGCDVALVVCLYLYLSRRVKQSIAFTVSAMWAASPLLIRMAMVPWNVSFIPVWTLAFIAVLEKLLYERKFQYLPHFAFLITVTTSIHVSLWPVAGLGAIICMWLMRRAGVKTILYTFLAGLLPLIPLIVHELTHSYENLHLFKFFLDQGSHGVATYRDMVVIVLTKYGYTIGRILTGEPLTWLGLTLTALGVVSGVRRTGRGGISIAIMAVIVGSLIYYRNTDFAEYYLAGTFIPLFLLMANLLQQIAEKFSLLTFIGLCAIVIAMLSAGWHERNQPGSPYSLRVKGEIIKEIKTLGYPVEVRTSLPRERDTGFPYIMKAMGLNSDTTAPRKVYIYETKNREISSPPEARSIIYERPIEAFKIVVFSN